MLLIAICDDEEDQLDIILTMTHQLLDKNGILFRADTFLSGETLIHKLESGIVYDIMFLDIVMNKVTGLEIGDIIRNQFHHSHTLLIYISAYALKAKEVFYYDSIRFLTKPIEKEVFEEALSYSCKKLIDYQRQIVSFQDNKKKQISLKLINIFYFETSSNHKINVITDLCTYVFYANIADLESNYSRYDFLRIHQGYLVNFEHIKEISYKEVVMTNGITLCISAPRRKAVRKRYLEIRQWRKLGAV